MRGTIPFLGGTPVGHYRLAAATGLTTTIAANGTIFSARWGGVTYVRPLILRLEVTATLVTPFTAANEIAAAAYVARSFTAADTGGTGLTLTGINNVQNSLSDVPTTATINVAQTAALTPGTRTLDANPILYLSGAQTLAAAGANPLQVSDVFQLYSADSLFPFNLQNAQAAAANAEGIVVTIPTLQGAGGTVRYVIEMDWIEYGYGPGTVPGAIA